MKAIVIGISPDYNYPLRFAEWKKNDTYYSSNHGASLICRAIIKEFNATYVDDFSDITSLKNKYDTCFLALATHITSWRDVSYYTELVEKLDMKTLIVSLGVEADIQDADKVPKLHPSMIRLLKAVSLRSNYIGVRGHYTTALLNRFGFSNVVPIGCPTLYYGLQENIKIDKPQQFSNPLIVYHRSLVQAGYTSLSNIDVLGQDFLDEVIFSNRLDGDTVLKEMEEKRYQSIPQQENVFRALKNNGKFVLAFNEWFDEIGRHDFIFGPRLHGCIAGLIQGRPSLLIGRDYRIREITEFFRLPVISFQELKARALKDIYNDLDFSDFESLYKIRFRNYLKFLQENKLEHQLQSNERIADYLYTGDDVRASLSLLHKKIAPLEEMQNYHSILLLRKWDRLLAGIPGVRYIYKKIARR